MDNTNQKYTTPIDIAGMKKEALAAKPNLVPTIFIRSETNSTQVAFLEKIVKTEILVNIFLVLILVVLSYVSFVLRFDILKYFNKNNSSLSTKSDAAIDNTNFRVIDAQNQAPNNL